MLPKDWLKSWIGAALASNQEPGGAKLPLPVGKNQEPGGQGREGKMGGGRCGAEH